MGKLIDIDFAIIETLRVHPDFTPTVNALYMDNMTHPEGIDLRNFTSSNGARAKMKDITQTDMLHFILDEAVKCYNAMAYFYYNDPNMKALNTVDEKMANLLNTFPYYGVVLKAVEIIANPKINSAIFYKTDSKELMALVDAVTNCRYQKGDKLREFIDKSGVGLTALGGFGTQDLFAKIDSDIKKYEVAKNVQVNPKATNQCLLDVMSGAQLKNKHNEYGLSGTLYATQDIGKRRGNQEDAVIILEHPENPEFKLIAVSDGMGGVELGDKASSYLTQQLARWFKSLPADLYSFPMEVQQLLNKKIAQISNEICKQYNSEYRGIVCGATVVASIVTQEYTINSTVGDSRIYTIKDDKLELITRDESAVWPPYKEARDMTPAELDDLRFVRNNNEILRCIGQSMDASHIQSLMIPNSSYDKIILLSDGVTDLLSQEDIRVISRKYPTERITHELVEAAITNMARRARGADERHYSGVNPGKDNATAAMYARR